MSDEWKEEPELRLQRINYADLSSKQKEIFNFQKIAGALADYGFNCIKLADDWQGADFLAYHKDGEQTLKVQLKARVTIDRKYLGKGLFMAFPNKGIWYLVQHDELVRIAEKRHPGCVRRHGKSMVCTAVPTPIRRCLLVSPALR